VPATDAPARDALIVAGGRGTRLQPLTFTTPKPLLPFCGAPFLSGVIQRLAAAGVERVFLVVGSDTAPFEVLRPDAAEHGVELHMVTEDVPLDTAGGVRSVVDELRGPFLVLNGDILTDVDYAEVVGHHREADADATLVLTRVEDTSSYGVCVRDGTRIVDFVEKPAPGTRPGQDAVNAGTYVLEPHVFDGFAEGRLSFERQVFPGILADGMHIEGHVHDGTWADLGTPDRWRDGHRKALSQDLAWPTVAAVADRGDGVRVAEGVSIAEGVTLVGPVLVLRGACVSDGATVGPDVVIGPGACVGPDATLSDSVLFDRAVVGAGVAATGLVAGVGSAVAAGARLGRDVVIGDGEVVPGDRVLADGERVPTATDAAAGA
jgi:mannose-1-phosphate guanylyltransferase